MQKNTYHKYKFVFVAAALMISFSFAAAFSIQAESIEVETLAEIESRLWGETYQQSVDRRIERLEYQLYGQSREGQLDNRLQSLADYILPAESAPSLDFLLSFLENHKSTPFPEEPVLTRLETLEEIFEVQPAQQAVVPRLHQLFAEVSENSNPDNSLQAAPSAEINLKPGMEFMVRLDTSVDSGRSQTGELIDFTLEEDFIVDDVLVLPAGTEGRMRLSSSESAGYLGRDGELSLKDHSLHSLDGKRLRFSPPFSTEPEGPVDSTINFISRHRSRFLAAGAGVAGALILDHPGGLIFSFAVPGQEESYQQGEIIQMEISRPADVFGIPLDDN